MDEKVEITFKPGDLHSIGMELELQLLDAKTLNLAEGILPLIELYPENPYVKPEFVQNTVEIASKVCYSLPELKAHVASQVAELRDRCRALGMALCGAGTHPFYRRLAPITPFPRYVEQEKSYGYLAHTFVTFATHVHLGMPSAQTAIALMRELKAYLPVLIALSASSPFWRGYATGFASYRHRVLAAHRSYGIPPSFPDWDAFCDFLQTARRAGVFKTINDIHWDLRPRPHLGTLEVRVMDAQSSVGDAVCLAAFIQTLATYLSATPPQERPASLPKPMPWWLEKENHFQASHLGLSANYVDERGEVRALHEVIQATLESLEETAEALGHAVYLNQLRAAIASDPNYVRQWARYKNTGSMKKVVGMLVDELAQE